MRVTVAWLAFVLSAVTGCSALRASTSLGLDRDDMVCVIVVKDSPGPITIGYRTRFVQRDSVAFRRETEQRLGKHGYERVSSWQAASDPTPFLLVPFYRDVAPTCQDLDPLRTPGLLFRRRTAAARAPPA